MNQPYGGKLIDRISPDLIHQAKKGAITEIEVDMETAKDIINIANGLYSPLTGFMTNDEIMSVLEKKKLLNGLPWTIPIIFRLSKKEAEKININERIALKNNTLGVLALFKVSEKSLINKEEYCLHLYGTNDMNHPGVKELMSDNNNTVVSGDITLITYINKVEPKFNLSPKEVREQIKKKGWKTVVAFQTRNIPHLAHEYIQKMALEFVDGLFVNPIIGKKKTGGFRDEVVLSAYERLLMEYYPENSTMLSIFPSRMYYAGPREAVFHAIVRKNFGCTHMIIGRDHAGVGDFYDKFAAHKIFDEIGDIGMQIFKISSVFYSPKLRMFATEKSSPVISKSKRIDPSGTAVRKMIQEKKLQQLQKIIRKEVLDAIFSFDKIFV